ncbi:hypothetical protein C2G38_2229078 [Gigaspora rosea]|uniref:Uncharacterized protein n=1 Tax=Gigaspora rosea TaxID=44941 RepID=A0A397TYX5_9GLOM|nr:hypothetical protein C2G38_2229078 [Gigaspora rosea]
MATKLFERLSNNHLELLDDKEDFNIIISTASAMTINNLWDDGLKEFLCHIANIFNNTSILSDLISKLPLKATEPLSTVINEKYAAEIASWVDKKAEAYSVINNPYEF